MRSAFLKPVTKPKFAGLANCLRDARHPHGPRQHPLWRLRPERWPESLVAGGCKRGGWATGVVMPVFSGSGILRLRPCHDRCARGDARGSAGGCGTEGQRGHPPAAAWVGLLVARGVASRAGRISPRWLFQKGRELSADKPLLFLVAPALPVHPATGTRTRCCATSRLRSNGNSWH
jgi:hypothetical protein